MKKLNEIVYNKLILQHEEAKERGLNKLASGIIACAGALPEQDYNTYSWNQMDSDVYADLWKTASNILKYYDVTSLDAEELNNSIELFAEQFINNICKTIKKDSSELGPLEPKLIGQEDI